MTPAVVRIVVLRTHVVQACLCHLFLWWWCVCVVLHLGSRVLRNTSFKNEATHCRCSLVCIGLRGDVCATFDVNARIGLDVCRQLGFLRAPRRMAQFVLQRLRFAVLCFMRLDA